MNKIDKSLVEQVDCENDPDTFDQRLHALGSSYDEFIVVNPKYEWILDYVDTDAISSKSCIVWAIDNLWLIKKFKQSWTPSSGWKIIDCKLDLEKEITINPDIDVVDYDIDFNIPIEDMYYEHVFYLDKKYNPTDDNIWVAKCKFKDQEIQGIKDRGYVSPKFVYNPDIPANLDYYIRDNVPYYDLIYEHVWMLDSSWHSTDEQIWAAKTIPKNKSLGTKIIGNIGVDYKNFEVVFISYNESNAEANWHRVLEAYPKAKRVHGVKGIFEAHKKAAEIVSTEMFYVVDGDAELIDNWRFDYRPNVFDYDCVHLWTSINPINDLEYGWGGIKLFPRQLLLDAKTWQVDLTTGLGKLKYINKVSNVTRFNADEFATWRSAFRECAKLGASLQKNSSTDDEQRLQIWTTVGKDRPYGEYALHGASLGKRYGFYHSNNLKALQLINNYEWMKNEFDKFYKH
jgi:hypothetical protein